MKKIILASVLSLVLLVAFGLDAKAQMAKEGTASLTEYVSGTYKVLAMGEERLQITFEHMGVLVNDAGEGFLHNSSLRVMGIVQAVKGIKVQESGSLVYTDPDGDKVFLTYKGTGGKLGPEGYTNGAYTIVGGTGKYSGITGGGEFTWRPVQSAAEGTYQGITKGKVHWKLP